MRKISLLTLRSAGPIEFQHIYLRTYMVVRSRIARNRKGGVRDRKHKEVETYFHLRMCTLNSVTRLCNLLDFWQLFKPLANN